MTTKSLKRTKITITRAITLQTFKMYLVSFNENNKTNEFNSPNNETLNQIIY